MAIGFLPVGCAGQNLKIRLNMKPTYDLTAKWNHVINVMLDAGFFGQAIGFSVDGSDGRVVSPGRRSPQFSSATFDKQRSDAFWIGFSPAAIVLLMALSIGGAPFNPVLVLVSLVLAVPLGLGVWVGFLPQCCLCIGALATNQAQTVRRCFSDLKLIAGLFLFARAARLQASSYQLCSVLSLGRKRWFTQVSLARLANGLYSQRSTGRASSGYPTAHIELVSVLFKQAVGARLCRAGLSHG